MEADLGDIANAGVEAELPARLRQTETHLLRAIDEALMRMRKGTHGICEICNQPISKVRLERALGAPLPRLQGSAALRRVTFSVGETSSLR